MGDETNGDVGNGKVRGSVETGDVRDDSAPPRRGEAKTRVVSRSARETLARGAEVEEDDEPTKAEEGLMALREALETQMRERPYVTLACAVGAGVLLGQALSTRAGRVALLAAGGYAATRFLRSDGLGVLSNLLGDDVDDDDPDELPATRDVHS